MELLGNHTHVYTLTNAMIFKRNLKNFIFCPQNYPERCSPRTVCNNLLYTVAICSTVCNNLLQSVARMVTLCNKKNCCYIASPFVLRFVTNCYIPSRCYIPCSISAHLSLFRAESVIFLGLHTLRFSSCNSNVYVFCACVTTKKKETSIFID